MSIAFLTSLHSQTEEEALSQLLSHLPLLNPGNTEARAEYMNLLPKVMLGSSEEMDYRDLCRQLLSLALVHPAFPHEDREALTYWLSQLDSKHKSMAAERQERQQLVPSPSSASPSSSSQQTIAPPLPPRIRQVHTAEDISLSHGNGRIYIEGELSHSSLMSHPHHHQHDHLPPPSDPYSADDEEVQRALAFSKTFQLGQAHHFEHTPPSCYEEGGVVKEKANTVPRVSGAGPKEDMEKDPGMRGEAYPCRSVGLISAAH